MLDNLRGDFAKNRADRKFTLESGGWSRSVWLSNLRILAAMNTWTIITYRFAHWVVKLRIPVVKQLLMIVAVVLERWVRLWTGIIIDRDAEIGPGLVVHTPYAVFVGATRIGANCTVCSGVVISAGSRGIGDNVFFGPGAKLLGTAKVGNNVVIMANSLVLTDVPDDTTIVGVPARIRLRGGKPQRFAKTTVG
ncbi:MAG: serine acetyltransferase [Acidobacteriia bacterium]|nr:serine acetyltransferase [Terriglobia bacterium]